MNFREWARATHKALKARPVEERQRDFTAAEVETVLRASIETLVDALIEGGDLYVRSLGRLYVKEMPARRVVSNLREHKKPILVDARAMLQASMSASLSCKLASTGNGKT